jgi:hypothetical protein
MQRTKRTYLPRPSQVNPNEPWTLPAGIELPNGVFLAYPAHRACGCVDCRAAFDAYSRSGSGAA